VGLRLLSDSAGWLLGFCSVKPLLSTLFIGKPRRTHEGKCQNCPKWQKHQKHQNHAKTPVLPKSKNSVTLVLGGSRIGYDSAHQNHAKTPKSRKNTSFAKIQEFRHPIAFLSIEPSESRQTTIAPVTVENQSFCTFTPLFPTFRQNFGVFSQTHTGFLRFSFPLYIKETLFWRQCNA